MRNSLICLCLLQLLSPIFCQQLDGGFFEGVEFEVFEHEGVEFRSPVAYRDLTQMSASFTAPLCALSALVPLVPGDFELIRTSSDRALVVIAASRFRDVDGIGPYDQFGLFVPVSCRTPGGAILFGYYVVLLLVNTREACRSGDEGVRKSLADISFRKEDKAWICEVRKSGKLAVAFRVDEIPGELKLQRLENYCYSSAIDRILRYRLQSRGFWGMSALSCGASFELGCGETAELLRSLDMSSESVAQFYGAPMQTLLHRPELLPKRETGSE